MNNEFKKVKAETETRYVLETMTAGATGASSIASSVGNLGKVQKRQDNILAQEADKITVPVTQKPRQGPLRPQTGGGKHRDKKKEQKQGKEKHRKPFAEDHEISMASNELKSITGDAMKLLMLIKRYSEMDGLEAWQQSKITKAADYLNSVLQSINGDQTALEGYGRYGRSSWDSNMPDWQRREQDAWDDDKRAFKYAELQHELGHEEEPYRPQRRFSSASSGMYFYNVKPGQENDALAAGLKQTKSGKWYSKYSNPSAEKTFGPGKFWQPKSESVSEDTGLEFNGKVVDTSTLEVDGVNRRDHPDYSDAYFSHAAYTDGTPLTDDELDQLTDLHGDLVNQMANEKFYESVTESKKKPNATTRHLRDYPVSDKEVAKPVKKPEKKKPEQGVAEEKQKGVDGKACWKGYKRMGTKKKGGKTVDNCVKVGEDAYSESLMNQLNSIISEKAPPGDKYERMVKHIKKGYAKDGKITDKERSIAYATAWKAKNKSKK